MIPSVNHYGKTEANRTRIDFGRLSVYYSYGRAVAFSLRGDVEKSSNSRGFTKKAVFLASENVYSRTTGKHLNEAEKDFASVNAWACHAVILPRAEALTFSKTLEGIFRLLFVGLDEDKTMELWAMMGDETARKEV